MLRDVLLEALDGDLTAAKLMAERGVIVSVEENGFAVMNRAAALCEVFEGTEWANFHWGPVLRRLPGALPWKAVRSGDHVSRSVFLPDRVLDEELPNGAN